MDAILFVLALLIGLLGGSLAGLFGIGGASIIIPLMHLILGMDAHEVIGTALPLTIPAALTGALVYRKNKLLNYRAIIVCGAAGALASVAGAMLNGHVHPQLLMGLLGALLVLLGFITHKQRDYGEEKTSFGHGEKLARMVIIGIIAGSCSGFFGLGGGVVLMPLLMGVLRMPYKEAVASSLAIVLVYSIPGAATHFALGNVNLPVLGAMFLGAIGGAWVGANKVISTKGGEMKNYLAVLLVVLGIATISYEVALFYGLLGSTGTGSPI